MTNLTPLIIIIGIVVIVGIIVETLIEPSTALRFWNDDEWRDRPSQDNPWSMFGRR